MHPAQCTDLYDYYAINPMIFFSFFILLLSSRVNVPPPPPTSIPRCHGNDKKQRNSWANVITKEMVANQRYKADLPQIAADHSLTLDQPIAMGDLTQTAQLKKWLQITHIRLIPPK